MAASFAIISLGCAKNLVDSEVMADRLNLEAMFGGVIRGLAYPFGTYSDTVVDALKNTGVAYARTVNSTNAFYIPQDWLRLHPTCHHAAPNLPALCDRFLNDTANFCSMLFYLWGHSYEFEAQDNWQIIEDFCEKMGGRDDVWYATNIQVYDYKTAYDRLIWNGDCTKVYNPTATDIWFHAKKQEYCVKAGQTLTL